MIGPCLLTCDGPWLWPMFADLWWTLDDMPMFADLWWTLDDMPMFADQ